MCVSKMYIFTVFFLFFMYVLYTTLYISEKNNKLKKMLFYLKYSTSEQCQQFIFLSYNVAYKSITYSILKYTYSIQCIQNQSKIKKKKTVTGGRVIIIIFEFIKVFIADLFALLTSLISHSEGECDGNCADHLHDRVDGLQLCGYPHYLHQEEVCQFSRL